MLVHREVVVSKKDNDQVIFKGFRYNNLYLVDFTSEDAYLKTCLFIKTSFGWLWHRRLAHIGMSALKKLMKNNLVKGLKDVKFKKDKLCSACQAGKQVANTHPTKAFMSTTRVLELLYIDLFGPTTYKSLGGNLYCLVIVDDYQDIHGCSSFMINLKLHHASRSLPREHKMSLK